MEKLHQCSFFKGSLLIHGVLIIVLLMSCLVTAMATNITTDQSALITLKSSVTSDPHKVLANNWSSSAAFSVCDWVGVMCGSGGGNHRRVTAVNISRMDLSGSIPPQLGNLSFLVSLDLSNNNFHGSLPDDLGHLYLLKIMNLSFNNFEGEIPPSFGSLNQLKFFSLKNNSFTGSIPPSISNMSNLETCWLTFNGFQGNIPREFGQLLNLKNLIIEYNQLSGSIPYEILNISSLEAISLVWNSLSGSLPDSMCQKLQRLNWFNVEFNMLSGPLPSSFGECSELRNILMDHNKFSGDIPKGIGNLKQLQFLYLDYNNLTGSIPREFGNLTMVGTIALQSNQLTGTIPRELGNLSNLDRLVLQGNNLRGPIPFDSLANCKNLAELLVGYNPLNLVLPDSIGNLSSSLKTFEASKSGINGSIPLTVGNLSGLVYLDLSMNSLSGTIPSSMKSLQNLQKLALRGNKISGTINTDDGSGLCGLQSLSEIYLEYNDISGPIPECLGNILSLRKLWFCSNRFDGNVPTSFGNLKDLIEFNLSGNILNGSLPAELGNLKAATLIDLSMNRISGDIPASMGNLLNLQTLFLQGNEIQDSIPSTFGEMVGLVSLDLSYNNLSGQIPNSLEKLKYLKYFNVSFNYLSGEIPEGGPFLSFGSDSFGSNRALCGSPRFNVPPCPNNSRKKKRKAHHFPVWTIIFLAVALSVFVITALVFVYLTRFTKKLIDKNNETKLESIAGQERISYYEILQSTEGCNENKLLGKGSFGSVYKGTLSDGRIVAVKVFNNNDMHDDDDDHEFERVSKSFEVECRLLSQLRHRNLTKVISCCCVNYMNFKALVLEYMSNGSLEQWLYSENYQSRRLRGPDDDQYCLNLLQRLNIMVDVASALDYLHSGSVTPVVHCDIKPSNVLLDEDMVAHVSDFGIAKLLGHEDSITCTQTLATFGYLAPEYGLEGLVSTKCDVYSYGILLMEVFTRKKPNDEMFEGNVNLRSLVHGGVLNSSLATVVDSDLLLGTDEVVVNGKGYSGTDDDHMLGFVKSIMEVALHCTKDSPRERFTMSEAIAALEKIKVKIQP